jgi:hypothetical protein
MLAVSTVMPSMGISRSKQGTVYLALASIAWEKSSIPRSSFASSNSSLEAGRVRASLRFKLISVRTMEYGDFACVGAFSRSFT